MLGLEFPVLDKDSDVLRDERVIVWEVVSKEGIVSNDLDPVRKSV